MSEHRGFKKAKERTWDGTDLGAKTFREIMLKNSQEKTWDRASLRKETLKNRKEDFKSKVFRKDSRSKVLKNCRGVRP
jgi:hypothetical protein